MTPIYDTPARPWAFGPLTETDIVGQQAEALVRRYDLLDALAAEGSIRRDLDRSSPPDPRLIEEMARQLVAWVDYVPEPGAGDSEAITPHNGWPIPQGVRLEALCYSPWLDGLRAPDGTVAGKRVFTLPDSADAFARDFHIRAGLPLGLDAELRDSFRLTPLAAGEVAMDIRGKRDQPSRAFLLLMCRHFEAARAVDVRLARPHPALIDRGYPGPAIVAFERLADLERAGAIVREVERHADAGAKLRPLLDAANDPAFVAAAQTNIPGVAWSQPLADLLMADPAVRTLCEFLAVSTPALASWYNATVAKRGTFHIGFRPVAALGHGITTSDIVTAVAGVVDVRTALLSAFRPAAKDRGDHARQSPLNNDILFKWYGLTGLNDNLGTALLADLSPARPVGAPAAGTPKKAGDDDVRHAVATIAARLGRSGSIVPTRATSGKRKTGKGSLNSVRVGAWLSRLHLPARLAPGAAARADETMWRDRYRDLAFWRFMQDPSPATLRTLGLRLADATRLRKTLLEFRRLVVAHVPQTRSDLTAKVMADLATGVSALTANPALADAIRQLAMANANFVRAHGGSSKMSAKRREIRAQLKHRGLTGALGLRHIPGIEGFTNPLLKRKRRSK